MCAANFFLGILAILFPPLPVWVKRGLCSADSVINIALCILGYFPGLIHSWYIIAATPDEYEYERVVDVERDGAPRAANASYHYVAIPAGRGGHAAPASQFPGQQQGTRSYGTTGPSQPGPRPEGTRPEEVPPTYNEAIKGDHKVQRS